MKRFQVTVIVGHGKTPCFARASGPFAAVKRVESFFKQQGRVARAVGVKTAPPDADSYVGVVDVDRELAEEQAS